VPENSIAPDQAARDRIISDLETTLFVEAGAGSGKTTSLVARVVALVTTGAAELSSIAAITFTEKAGAELRDRVRRQLEERAKDETDPQMKQRCRTAVDQLDASAIGTLHSFAKRLLSENPIEAGPGWKCWTKCPPAWSSSAAGAPSATKCWPTLTWSGRSFYCSPPA